MKFIEKQIDLTQTEPIRSYFSIDCMVSENCNSVILYPDPYCKLIFNFSEDKAFLNGVPLPQVFFIKVTDKILNFEFVSNLKFFGIKLKSNNVIKKYLQTTNKEFTNIIKYKSIYDTLKKIYRDGSIDDHHNLIIEYIPALMEDFIQTDKSNLSHILHPVSKIKDIAQEQQKSVRQIERLYKENLGVTPKIFHNLNRFENIKERIWINPDTSFTELAYEFDFVDQSHFNKEFKKMTNLTPKQFSKNIKCIKSQQENT